MSTTQTHTLTVGEYDASTRLDKFISDQLEGTSRARVQQLLDEGQVSPSRNASYKVKEGETYTITVPEVKALQLTPEKIALDVVFEDEHLLVINKAPGMTVHPAPGAQSGTLVHALLAHCGDTLSGIGGVARPGIVHRIDKDTSGLLVVAKNDAAHQSLSAQLKDRTLSRTYICYVWGALTPREGEIDAPIARNPRMRKQMAVVEGGKHALTFYETMDQYIPKSSINPVASKVMCQLDTGRTHQIRVHMAHRKCQLIGDALYGTAPGTRFNRMRSSHSVIPQETLLSLTGFHRQALHALELALIHPFSGEEMLFSCPIPADLEALERTLLSLTNRA
ncbi:MAG: RNA pseudouridine synthase [Azospirillum brasilense]|nr:MAG: RNA pseudouridine synthase [Azospirillum brasilense]